MQMFWVAHQSNWFFKQFGIIGFFLFYFFCLVLFPDIDLSIHTNSTINSQTLK